jgi:hypothetical protein
MERYENIVKIEEMRKLTDNNQYLKAIKILDTMDINKIKALTDLSIIAEIYMRNERYDEAMAVLTKIYNKTKTRRILYQLVDLSIKRGSIQEAEDYLDRYIKIAPQDSSRFIFRYSIDKLQGESYEILIASLEQLKEHEYYEKWAYELAKVYHKAGMKDKCVRECSDIILWFGEGIYVEKAKLLKGYYVGDINPIHMLKAKEKKEAEMKLGLDKTKDYSAMRSQIDQFLAEGDTEGTRIKNEDRRYEGTNSEGINSEYTNSEYEEMESSEEELPHTDNKELEEFFKKVARKLEKQIEPENQQQYQHTNTGMYEYDADSRSGYKVEAGGEAEKGAFDEGPRETVTDVQGIMEEYGPVTKEVSIDEYGLGTEEESIEEYGSEMEEESIVEYGLGTEEESIEEYGSETEEESIDEYGLETEEESIDEYCLGTEEKSIDEYGLETEEESIAEYVLGTEEESTVEYDLGTKEESIAEYDNDETGSPYGIADEFYKSYNGEDSYGYDAQENKNVIIEPEVTDESKTEYASEETAENKTEYVPEETAENKTEYLPEEIAESKTEYIPEVAAESKTKYIPEVAAESKTKYIPEETAENKMEYISEVTSENTIEDNTGYNQETTEADSREYGKDLNQYETVSGQEERIVHREEYVEKPYLEGRFDAIFSETGMNFEKDFGYFIRMDDVRKQIEACLETILSDHTKANHIIIKGERKSGKTTLAKKISKALYGLNWINTNRVAKIEAVKLNGISLESKKDKLANCSLIIEDAGQLDASAAEQLMALIQDLNGNIFVILEDKEEEINKLFQRNVGLSGIFSSTINLPEYKLSDLVGFAYTYIQNNDYEFTGDVKSAFQKEVEKIVRDLSEEEQFETVMSLARKAKTSADERNKARLSDMLAAGDLSSEDFLFIRKEDFLWEDTENG